MPVSVDWEKQWLDYRRWKQEARREDALANIAGVLREHPGVEYVPILPIALSQELAA